MPHSITQLTVTSTADLADLTRLLRSFPVCVTNHGTNGGAKVLIPAHLPKQVEKQLALSRQASIYVPDPISSARDEAALRAAVQRYGYPLEVVMPRIGGKKPTPWTLIRNADDLEAYLASGECSYISYRRPIPA